MGACDTRPPARCRELACLTLTPSEHVMSGNIKFSTSFLLDGGGSAGAAEAEPAAEPAAVVEPAPAGAPA